MPEKDLNPFPTAGMHPLRPSDEARARAEGLHRRAEAPIEKRPGLLPDALEELTATVEELRVAEEEMRAQNEELLLAHGRIEAERHRYQDLFEFAPDGYLVTTPDGKVLEANRAASDLLGIAPRFLKGRGLGASVFSEDLSVYSAALSSIAALPAPPQEWAMRLRRRPTDMFHAAITVSVVPGFGGQPTTLRWLVRDVSVRRAAEAAQSADTERERRVSDALLVLLFAVPNAFPHLDIETFHPDPAASAGGFCDAFALAGGRIALVAGDVAGVGGDAATQAAQVKYALRVLLRQDDSPATVLVRLMDYITQAQPLGDFQGTHPVTLALATLDASTGETTTASAGAALSRVLRADGAAETFEEGGLMLGVGDTLLLAGGQDGEPLSPTRLAEIATAFQGNAVRGMGEAVLSAAGSGGACLLLARRHG